MSEGERNKISCDLEWWLLSWSSQKSFPTPDDDVFSQVRSRLLESSAEAGGLIPVVDTKDSEAPEGDGSKTGQESVANDADEGQIEPASGVAGSFCPEPDGDAATNLVEDEGGEGDGRRACDVAVDVGATSGSQDGCESGRDSESVAMLDGGEDRGQVVEVGIVQEGVDGDEEDVVDTGDVLRPAVEVECSAKSREVVEGTDGAEVEEERRAGSKNEGDESEDVEVGGEVGNGIDS